VREEKRDRKKNVNEYTRHVMSVKKSDFSIQNWGSRATVETMIMPQKMNGIEQRTRRTPTGTEETPTVTMSEIRGAENLSDKRKTLRRQNNTSSLQNDIDLGEETREKHSRSRGI